MFEPRSTRSEIVGAIVAGLIVVAFSLLLLWHNPLVFWNDDYEISILPVFADVARSWNEGHFPLLSPYSWICGNLAGEFQYGTFSVFVNAAVVLIWKFPLTFPQQAAALSIAHLFFLGAGAFLLARDRKLSAALSIFVALVAALNGWIICWGATDWFGALGAFTWLPWAWWGIERAHDRARSRWRILWPAPFVYLLVTGGFPYTVVMLAVLLAWLAIRSLSQMWERPQCRDSRDAKVPPTFSIWPMIFGVTLGFGLAAPAWLAIFNYIHGSARAVQSASTHWQWLVPPSAWPGLILPNWTVKWVDFSTRYVPHTATELACGIVPIPALLAGFTNRGRELLRQLKWEMALLVFVVVLAMFPTAGLFRWSFRWLPFIHLILAICAAEALRHLNPSSFFTRPSVYAFLLVALTAMAAAVFSADGRYAFPLIWIFLAIVTFWMLADFILRNYGGREWITVLVAFAALLATYFCIPPNGGVPKYKFAQELQNPTPLDPARLYLSVYPSPEFNYWLDSKSVPIGQVLRPGSTSMWAGVRLINGYSPIRPAGIARRLNSQTHGEIDPQIAAQMLEKEAGVEGELARIGVDGIIVALEFDFVPKPDSEWKLALSNDEGRVYYRIGESLPRVRSITTIDSRPQEQFVAATISRIHDLRNRVELDVDVPSQAGPALLTFSRPFFPGYQARLDNENLRVDSYRGLFPIVEIPAGSRGKLVLRYLPLWLKCGTAVSTISGVILLVSLFVVQRNRRRVQ